MGWNYFDNFEVAKTPVVSVGTILIASRHNQTDNISAVSTIGATESVALELGGGSFLCCHCNSPHLSLNCVLGRVLQWILLSGTCRRAKQSSTSN